jgi:hypothetical protein
MKNFITVSTLTLAATFSSWSFAASRYHADLQKFQAILDSKDCEAALGLSTLDGIELLGVDSGNRDISYRLKTDNGKCTVDVILSYDDDVIAPNYRVTSVGQKVCN